MNNKYILITGASSGIGKSLAYEFAKRGEKLILVVRRIEILEEFKKEFPETIIIKADLSDINQVNNVYKQTKDMNIFVYKLVNNAGFGDYSLFVDSDNKKNIDMINLNISGLITMTRNYLEDMKKYNEGYILNVSSIASFMPGPCMAVYYASKAFVTSFSRALDFELRKTNISVSILAPGPTNTGFREKANIKNSGLDKSFESNSSDYVAKYTLNNLNKKLIIPGWTNKITVFMSNILPINIMLYFVNKAQERKNK